MGYIVAEIQAGGIEQADDQTVARSVAAQVAGYRRETTLPGYWDTIEENCNLWAEQVFVDQFWREAQKLLVDWSREFRRITGGDLLNSDKLPKFVGKSAARIKSKVFGKIGRTPQLIYQLLPSDGPAIPRLDDLVRTRVECRYLDGVEFFASKLENLAISFNAAPKRQRQGKLVGYFAQHLYFDSDVYFRFAGASLPARITCEVQVATELSTRIWDATHSLYEQWRENDEKPDEWQWSPNDPRFLGRQLGHMIHLADGILVQLRDASHKSE